jgi:hypothetical protein
MGKNILQNGLDLAPDSATSQSLLLNPLGWVLCQSSTSTASSLAFIGLSQYPYTDYLLIMKWIFTTGVGTIPILTSVNNGGNLITSGYSCFNTSAGNSSTAVYNPTTASFLIDFQNSWYYGSVNAYFSGFNTTTLNVLIEGSGYYSSSSYTTTMLGGGQITNSSPFNAIVVQPGVTSTSAQYYLFGFNGV